MTRELVVAPHDDQLRSELSEAPAWGAFVAELRGILRRVIEQSGADSMEVSELLVGRPLPDRWRDLRNGTTLAPSPAMALIEDMAAGHGPYCRLVRPGRLQIESGWDGAVHLYVTSAVAADLAGLRGTEVAVQWRDGGPEPSDVTTPVETIADESFWDSVRETADRRTVLVCERWAHGAHGCRWFQVNRDNVTEVAGLVRPRSLLCVITEPELTPGPEILEDTFTAFRAPLRPGELVHRAYPGGADSLAEVTDEGFTLMLADESAGDRCAVVPDPDGVSRGLWQSPRAL